MDRSSVQDWLDRYSAAWELVRRRRRSARSSRPTPTTATTRRTGRRRPSVGADAIVEPTGSTAESRRRTGTYDSHYEPYAVDGDRAVAVGWSRYYTDATKAKLEREYRNAYLLEFDAEGRCTDFTEFFMETRKKS